MSNGGDISIRIQAISAGVEDAVKQLRDLEAGLKSETSATQGATPAIEGHSRAQTTLANTFGVSRREAGLMTSELLSVSGVSGQAANAIGALTSGLGPAGLTAVALAGGLQFLSAAQKSVTLDTSALTAELGKLSKANEAAIQLALLAGVEEKSAASALEFAKGNQEAAARLQALVAAAQPATPVLSGLSAVLANAATTTGQLGALVGYYVTQSAAYHAALREGKTELEAQAIAQAALHVAIQGMTDAQKAAINAEIEDLKKKQELKDLIEALDKPTANLTVTFEDQTLRLRDAATAATELAIADAKLLAVAGQASNPDAFKVNQNMRSSVEDMGAMQNFAKNDLVTVQLKRWDDATRLTSTGLNEARRAAEQLQASFVSLVQSQIASSQVTQEDMLRTRLGMYQDKPDENRRRLKAFVEFEDDPAKNELFKKLPQKYQDALADAFKSGGKEKSKITAMDLIGNFDADPSAWNVGAIADSVQRALKAELGKKQLLGEVLKELASRGIDTSNTAVQAALGQATGSAINAGLGTQDLSQGLMDSFTNNADKIKAAGKVAGNQLLGGIATALSDEDKGLKKKIAQAIAPDVADILSGLMKTGGGKAAGGGVSAGTAYLVGEQGPETFVPGTGGTIIPNGARGGNVYVYQTFTSTFAPSRYDLEKMKSDMRRAGF